MEINKLTLLVLFVGLIGIASASAPFLGYFKLGEEIELKQTCAINGTFCDSCNITSVDYPNGSMAVSNIKMTKRNGDFNYTLSGDYIDAVGEYRVNGFCDYGDDVRKTWVYTFETTLSGVNPDGSNPFVSLGLMGLIFGIACVFLFISTKLYEVGPKLFFILASFVFLIGALAVSYVIAFDSNLTSSINSTIVTMLYAFGLIFIVMFAYIMIKQIKESVNMMRQNQGYDMEIYGR